MTALIPATLSKAPPSYAGPAPLLRWQPATWDEYSQLRDELALDEKHWQLSFDENAVLAFDMGWEGIKHAIIRDLFVMLFAFWLEAHPEQLFTSIGQCLLEKKPLKAGAPDLAVYLGDDYPTWQPGESRIVDLHRWPVPSLVGEVADTTLATDMDRKKRIYAALGIPEYWVIDVRGAQVFIFQLDEAGDYQTHDTSHLLTGISVELLESTIDQVTPSTNGQAALWFSRKIKEQSKK